MFSNYSLQKSSQFDYIVSGDTASLSSIKNYNHQAEAALEKLKQLTLDDPAQQKNIDHMMLLVSGFMESLDDVTKTRKDSISIDAGLHNKMAKVTDLMEQVRVLKDEMIATEAIALEENEDSYMSSVHITPLAVLGLALVSLIVFSFAFWRIIKNRRELAYTKAFLNNILSTTDNLIDHYESVRDENNEIVDFKVVYCNDRITGVTGMEPSDVIGKLLSELYPATFENGYFEMIKDCVENQEVIQFENHYNLFGEIKTFWTTAINLGNAVTITSVDVTPLRSTTKKLEEINQELAVKNTAFNKAEAIGRGGSFRFDIKTGVAEFSENFHRVFGLNPTNIKVSFSKFRSFVHPDDIEKFDKFITELRETKQEKQQNYRIITKDGMQRSLMATGRFVIENDRDFLVGIVQDITQELQRKALLEDQNIELKRSNDELGSFNHVVSHDLQEPLRKIQMFISLINEEGLLSDENRLYFKKTEKAAQRMQTLIKHLLTYSRIGNNDKDLKLVDLNEILKKVQENQNELIANNHVKIVIKQMPTVLAIPFQMEQLFNNIISNALKYSKTDEESKVLITSEVVHRTQIHDDFRKKFKNYHKISIIDNGIGFSQGNSEKIFELFQRLHQTSEYSGTGIGLAICKKITENHSGFISAISEENRGATFIIYLPEN